MRGAVIVVGQVPPPVHGTTVMTRRLLEALSDRWQVTFVDKGLSDTIQDVGRAQPRKIWRAIKFYRRAARVIAAPSPRTCVYFLSCSAPAFVVDAFVIRNLLRHGVKVVLYLHGIGFTLLAERRPSLEPTIARVLGGASAVVVLGRGGQADVARWVSGDCITVIPNAIPDPGPPTRHGASGVCCLYLATLDRSKGALAFLDSAERTAPRVPEARFVLAGQCPDPAFGRELQARCEREALRGRVSILGPTFGAEKEELFRSADIFIFPTQYPFENSPLVNIEAMSYGLPIITSSIGSIPDQVSNDGNGFLVDASSVEQLSSRMERLLRDPDLRTRMGTESRRRYEAGHTLAAFSARWDGVLGAVVEP